MVYSGKNPEFYVHRDPEAILAKVACSGAHFRHKLYVGGLFADEGFLLAVGHLVDARCRCG